MKPLLATAAALRFVACAPAVEPTPTLTATPEVTPMPPEVTPMPREAKLPAVIMDPIYADVIERSGASLDRIEVDRAEAVTWPDPSLVARSRAWPTRRSSSTATG